MKYQILKNKSAVDTITCDPAKFHPKVSRVANRILNQSPTGTIVHIKVGRKVLWTGKKQFKKVITGGV